MAGVNSKISVSISAEQAGTATLGSKSAVVGIQEDLRFVAGTATQNESDILYSASRTLAASATEDLDLTGTLTDAFGTTVAAAEVMAVFIKAKSTNTNNVVIGAAGSNPWVGALNSTGTITLKAGDWVCLGSKAGFVVTATTGDLLKVANSAAGSSVSYEIVVIGRSVAR
jgi:hypothetical protein